MAHQCADCEYPYADEDFKATPPEQRRCPMCGSGRINATVQLETIATTTRVFTPSILITTQLWWTWLRIAIDRAHAARVARVEASKERPSNEVSAWMSHEFEASVVAIAAAAHALDALYGSTVVPPAVRAAWVATGTKRHGKIREALKQVFDTGPVNARWVTKFDWLFDLRDAAAHADESPKPPVPHPLGTNTAQEMVDYSTEVATMAVDFALSVFRWCVDHPRGHLSDAVQWAHSNQAAIGELEQEWSMI